MCALPVAALAAAIDRAENIAHVLIGVIAGEEGRAAKAAFRLFLTTVDENIASNAIEDMASIGVYLVIPESLHKAKETEYEVDRVNDRRPEMYEILTRR